ncbi:MAG: hypothetical protein J6T63_03840 [Bacteroidales bacterium]|nr:hypothetical protein [Bacteroidales bacterium]
MIPTIARPTSGASLTIFSLEFDTIFQVMTAISAVSPSDLDYITAIVHSGSSVASSNTIKRA